MLRRTTFLTTVVAAIVAVSTPAAADPDDALLAEQWAFSPATVFDLPEDGQEAWRVHRMGFQVIDEGGRVERQRSGEPPVQGRAHPHAVRSALR